MSGGVNKDRIDPESLVGSVKSLPCIIENGSKVSHHHRQSISQLGPEQIKARKDAKYRKLQSKIYNFLERPRGCKAITYHVIVFLLVFTCLALSVFSTIKEYEEEAAAILVYMESFVVAWFAVEFIFRMWSSGCRSRYQGTMGRLKFARRPFCIIDIITICASIVVISVGTNGRFATSTLRILRFFQILRMVRMDRRGGTWKLLGSVVYAHRQELITTLYIGFLGLIFTSFLVYLAEKDTNEMFANFANALWWGVITLCTVGYGDVMPITWQGKLIASACAIMGISFFALPAGILGSGFALKVQQQQRQKHMIRRRQPAATLIQSVWRCYAAEEHSGCVATWKIHEMPLPSPPVNVLEDLKDLRIHLYPPNLFKHNTSFVTRLPTIRRKNLQSPGYKSRLTNTDTSRSDISDYHESRGSSDEEDEPRLTQLTETHKVAIRAIRKLKLLVSRRRFREAQRPYDVKDVIEQYSQGHADLLGRVRTVHGRLDQILGKQGSKSKDVYESKLSLASRVVKIERQVDDIENKLDQLIEMYMGDREKLLAIPALVDSSTKAVTDRIVSATVPPKPSFSFSRVLGRPSPAGGHVSDSAPTTPVTTTFLNRPETKPILQRGLSDVSQRIKKRVTLQPSPFRSVANRFSAFENPSNISADENTPLIIGSSGGCDERSHEASQMADSISGVAEESGSSSQFLGQSATALAKMKIVISSPDG
ncbi:potassium voltage-gated channel subfamily KQT member 1-like isoform X2 [Artemia franciscana]|uniref:potassium voltage-gated channel subfamily KQT member 1-like isoform X2 n=1 Tax=Artemia franciscana TaxID=6661 RepID=UPI0032DBC990